MVWTLPKPMLAEPVNNPVLPPGWAAEPKWDGYRALLARYADRRVIIRSRRGTDMTAAFPEITRAAASFPAGVEFAMDGELVVWEEGRVAFERLQGRLNRTAAGAARMAAQWPAHYVAFDLLRLNGTDPDLTAKPYAARRAALEQLFTDHALPPPWTLCPSTTDPSTAAEWLEWSAVGMEGLVLKNLRGAYRPATRAWRKYRVAHTSDAIIGAVSRSLTDPATALLGRYDRTGRFRYTGRSTVLSRPLTTAFLAQLSPAGEEHPWTGRTFSAAWGAKAALTVALVVPELVVEVRADVSRDSAGRWRHPVKVVRLRDDLAPADVPLFGDTT
ncbi:ATP-dependint DNA ligase [Streptomyces sp. CBMAI 2042]|uniref:ATP-dependent DNA ligase n=1 Tax=Streptomyces sp. CBMAI 2042 TaxID=2305222 RepID=UPI000F1AF51E|nr:ATP-dependent DNA ligase [Streptomyces sp. CBMAI 2042]RLV64210.1 ATP-dependint DNA ligase [Streptomyces sp. CBMAI 2042]